MRPDAAPAMPTAAAGRLPTAIPQAHAVATAVPAGIAGVSLTLEDKLAQMIMVGFRGARAVPADPIVADVAQRGVGAVVLFNYDVALGSAQRNIESPAQLAHLTADLQAQARIPLLIAADQEGGRVARLDPAHGFAPSLQAQELGERSDPAFTYAQAERMAKELAAAGINHNLAPVVDLNSNPAGPAIGALGRSFSADPAVVIAQAQAFIDAHHAHAITTTLKHFPGHGSAQADSHLGLVDVSNTWQPNELAPYRSLIGQGAVDSVMTAHVFNVRLDPDYPATLSQATINGLLRDELGFSGVVITDDMNMQAVAGQYGFAEAAVLAVQAGADLLAYGNNLVYDPDVAQRALVALLAAVKRGEISEERVEASYVRILALKSKWGQK